jgi:energy-coupling factor transporter ATP-binding protein EcfA2
MLSDLQKSLIVSIAVSKGFQGYHNDKFIIRGNKTGDEVKLYKSLKFPESLKEQKKELAEVIIDWESYSEVVGNLLRSDGVAVYKSLQPVSPPLPGLESHVETGELDALIFQLVPLINLSKKSGDRILLYNPNNNKILHDLDLDYYLWKMGKSLQELSVTSGVLGVIPYFDPYCLEPFVDKHHANMGIVLKHLNIYNVPDWRKERIAPNYGGFIKTLMEHLFPVAQEREDVLDWLHYALVRRNGSILCLAGPRGTGKSILMSILSYLIGGDYSAVVNKEILEEKFNSAFKNNRLIVFEEVEVSDSTALNKLKALSNNRIALEEKGKDAETIENYTSMAILLNDISQLKIDAQDRRFSVPKVAETDLKTVLNEKQIQDFVDGLEGEGTFVEAAEFGEWLLKRRPVQSYMYAIKGDYYYHICTIAMSEWKNFIIQYIADRGVEGVPIEINKIRMAFKVREPENESAKFIRFPYKSQVFDSFLGGYKHRGAFPVGKLVRTVDDTQNTERVSIMPNPDFLDYIHKDRGTKKVLKNNKSIVQQMEELDSGESAL